MVVSITYMSVYVYVYFTIVVINIFFISPNSCSDTDMLFETLFKFYQQVPGWA
jgi:hypothetical protein